MTPTPEILRWEHYWRLLRRQWAPVAAGASFGLLAGLAHASRQPPVYAAVARVNVGQDPWRHFVPDAMQSPYYSERITFDTQPHIITSRPVLERAADVCGEACPSPEAIGARLTVLPVEGTWLLALEARAGTAEAARAIVNSVVDGYIQVTSEQREKNARESVRWLETQLADYEQKVQSSHRTLVDYLETEKLAHFGNLDGKGDTSPAPLLVGLRERRALVSLDLEALRAKYGERHPDVVDKRAEVVRLDKAVKDLEGDLRVQQKKQIGFDLLAGRARADLDLYGVLARKLEQANITTSLGQSGISVVQYAALPAAPLRLDRWRTVLLLLSAGGLLGVGIGFLRETFFGRLESADEIRESAGVTVLGMIPLVREEGVATPRLFSGTPNQRSAEAFRVLRSNLRFALVGAPRRMVLVTSGLPSEGKSLVTANLALALEGGGHSVAVVDGDLRRPTLHRYFGLSAPSDGLSSLIADGVEDPDRALVRQGRLALLPAGPVPPNPGDLLDSPVLKVLLRKLEERFDVVLIDSPPASMFADAQVLAGLAGSALLVARAGVATRTHVAASVSALTRAGCRLVGAVLNGAAHQAGMAYYDYYYYSGGRETAAPEAGEKAPAPEAAAAKSGS